jgi:hypothetical protein
MTTDPEAQRMPISKPWEFEGTMRKILNVLELKNIIPRKARKITTIHQMRDPDQENS